MLLLLFAIRIYASLSDVVAFVIVEHNCLDLFKFLTTSSFIVPPIVITLVLCTVKCEWICLLVFSIAEQNRTNVSYGILIKNKSLILQFYFYSNLWCCLCINMFVFVVFFILRLVSHLLRTARVVRFQSWTLTLTKTSTCFSQVRILFILIIINSKSSLNICWLLFYVTSLWLIGRMLYSQSREPGFESPLLLFQSLGIFVLCKMPQFTQLYK